MSDARWKRIRAALELTAILTSILAFCGFTVFPQHAISDLINFGKISPNEAIVLVTIAVGTARIPFALASLFAGSGTVQVLSRRLQRSLGLAGQALMAIFLRVAPAVILVALVSFAVYVGFLIGQDYGQPARTLVAERWPAQALPNYNLPQLEKWRDANPPIIPVTYERPSESRPTAQLFADVKLSSKQKMASLKHSIEDLLGDRKLFVRVVELKDRKRSKRFYRMLAGPFESRSDVIRFCRAYNKRFNLHGRAACLPESVSLEIRTTADDTCYRRSAPRANAPSERLPETRGPDFIFPRLFNFDNII